MVERSVKFHTLRSISGEFADIRFTVTCREQDHENVYPSIVPEFRSTVGTSFKVQCDVCAMQYIQYYRVVVQRYLGLSIDTAR